jgi:hypothetical protein
VVSLGGCLHWPCIGRCSGLVDNRSHLWRSSDRGGAAGGRRHSVADLCSQKYGNGNTVDEGEGMAFVRTGEASLSLLGLKRGRGRRRRRRRRRTVITTSSVGVVVVGTSRATRGRNNGESQFAAKI